MVSFPLCVGELHRVTFLCLKGSCIQSFALGSSRLVPTVRGSTSEQRDNCPTLADQKYLSPPFVGTSDVDNFLC